MEQQFQNLQKRKEKKGHCLCTYLISLEDLFYTYELIFLVLL
jgi:hypothetical protein